MFTEYKNTVTNVAVHIFVSKTLTPWGVTENQFGGWGYGLQMVMPLIELSAFIFFIKYITFCVFPAVGGSDLCVHSDLAEAPEQHLKRIRCLHEIMESVWECFFYNYSFLVPQNRPGSQTKGPATEKRIELKYCRSLCSWHKFYLWFLLQLRVYTPVARCRPFLHGVMPEVIIISKNLNNTKGKEMSPVWTWKITPASQSIHVQACRECK